MEVFFFFAIPTTVFACIMYSHFPCLAYCIVEIHYPSEAHAPIDCMCCKMHVSYWTNIQHSLYAIYSSVSPVGIILYMHFLTQFFGSLIYSKYIKYMILLPSTWSNCKQIWHLTSHIKPDTYNICTYFVASCPLNMFLFILKAHDNIRCKKVKKAADFTSHSTFVLMSWKNAGKWKKA